MPSIATLTAEQAAQAIVYLSSHHATASDYMHSMDGQDLMSRSEFREYLRDSSHDEYLDLLRGHLPHECAHLARTAIAIQEKRAQSGNALVPASYAPETAERYFTALDFDTHGLHFKDVAEAIDSLGGSGGRKQKRQKQFEQKQQKALERLKAKAAKKSKTAVDDQDSSNGNKAAAANSASTKSEAAQARIHSESTDGTVTLETTKSKKRKLEQSSPSANPATESIVPSAASTPKMTRRERRKIQRETKFENIPQLQDVQSSTSPNKATINDGASSRTSKIDDAMEGQPAKKQKTMHGADNPPSEDTRPANQSTAIADTTLEHKKKKKNQKSRDRRKARLAKSKQLEQHSAAEKVQDDTEIVEDKSLPERSLEPAVDEDVDMTDAEDDKANLAPIPTQETTEFVTAVEPEDPFNDRASVSASNSSASDYADATEVFQPGRTSLPAVPAKVWKRSPEKAVPLSELRSSPLNGVTANMPDALNADEPLVEDEDQKNSEPSVNDTAPDTAVTNQNLNQDNSVSKSRPSPVKRGAVTKPVSASSPPMPSISAPTWLTSSQKPSSFSGRSSLGSNYLSHASLASLQPVPVQPRVETVPTGPDRFDPKVGLKNLNKFLNDGNSSDESDDESDSSSSDGDDAAAATLLKRRASTSQTERLKDHDDAPANPLLKRAATPWPEQNKEDSPASVKELTSFKELEASEPKTEHHRDQSPTPSFDLSKLPSSMDDGGYVPDFLRPGENSSRPTTGDDAGRGGSPFNIDLLGPFRDRDSLQGSAQGIVRPSCSRQASSNSSPKPAMETDPIQSSSLKGPHHSNNKPERVKQVDKDGIIFEFGSTDSSELEPEQTSCVLSSTTHNTEDDQRAASSQLLDEAVKPRFRMSSPRVIIHVTPERLIALSQSKHFSPRPSPAEASASEDGSEDDSSDDDRDESEYESKTAIVHSSPKEIITRSRAKLSRSSLPSKQDDSDDDSEDDSSDNHSSPDHASHKAQGKSQAKARIAKKHVTPEKIATRSRTKLAAPPSESSSEDDSEDDSEDGSPPMDSSHDGDKGQIEVRIAKNDVLPKKVVTRSHIKSSPPIEASGSDGEGDSEDDSEDDGEDDGEDDSEDGTEDGSEDGSEDNSEDGSGLDYSEEDDNKSKDVISTVETQVSSKNNISGPRNELDSGDKRGKYPRHRKSDNARPDSPSSMEWDAANASEDSDYEKATPPPPTTSPRKRKATGTTSKHFSVSPAKKPRKRVAGVSSVPFPKLSAPRFGLIQEKLCDNPFHLLLAVLFLNKTSGKVARDTIFDVIDTWPTPELLANADPTALLHKISKLGLQNDRLRKLRQMAGNWSADPPRRGRRHRVLHYPNKDDGKKTPDGWLRTSPHQILNNVDGDEILGFIEIGHLYGLGPYAFDSWRIFCRDVLRGVADGYNGEGVPGYNVDGPLLVDAFIRTSEREPQQYSSHHPSHLQPSTSTFEPEWKRVLPKDKELRACLRWMWLREGWDWDPLTGVRRPATVSEIREAIQGRAEWDEEVAMNPHGVDGGDADAEGALVVGRDVQDEAAIRTAQDKVASRHTQDEVASRTAQDKAASRPTQNKTAEPSGHEQYTTERCLISDPHVKVKVEEPDTPSKNTRQRRSLRFT